MIVGGSDTSAFCVDSLLLILICDCGWFRHPCFLCRQFATYPHVLAVGGSDIHAFYVAPQWGAVDAEIKVPSLRTRSFKVLPLKPGVD